MMTAESIPFLSEAALSALDISTGDVVDAIEAAIHGAAAGAVWSAPKAVIQPEDGRYMMAALAATDDPALLAVKTVVLNPQNPRHGLPQINGLVTMLHGQTGLPAAILDGNWITAVRTAGLSMVAARKLARPDASTIGFIGAGVQAQSHLDAFVDLYPVTGIKVFSRGRKNIDLLCESARAKGLSADVCSTAREAVDAADLIVTSVTLTGQFEPFVDARWLKPGAFATVTDLAVPWIKQSFSALDRLVIDDLNQEAALPNKLAPPEFVSGDLAGLVLGDIDGRQAESERTAFVFRGHALGDLALSALVWRKSGLGG